MPMTLLAALLILTGLAWAVFLYNRLVRDRNRVRAAWSDIDVQLKRRHDLIPKLVAAVGEYARYEQATLTTLTELRSRLPRVAEVPARGALEGTLGQGLQRLLALVEAYPQLRADRSFLQLQNDLSEVENHIQYARRYYNGAVRNLNIRIASFPDLLLARLFRFAPEPFFELASPSESRPPEARLP